MSGPSYNPPQHETVPWQEWSREAFQRAADERRPVLLNIGASWCHGCAAMEQATYARPDIVAAIVERTVPIKVDSDRRPDVNDRYNLDGWPTTALLTPSGEILTGSTYVTPDLMLRMLGEAADALRERYDELMTRAAAAATARRHKPPPNRYEPDAAAPEWVTNQILGQHDAEHGGFGADGKFLHLAPLRFALARYVATRHDALGDVVRRSLTALLASPMVDESTAACFVTRPLATGPALTPRRCSRIRRAWPACCSTRPASSTYPIGLAAPATSCASWSARCRTAGVVDFSRASAPTTSITA